MPKFLTTQEVADLFRRPPATIRYWRHVGTGPRGIRVGRRVLYDALDVEMWVDQQRKAQGAA